MITTVYTIEEIKFINGNEESKELLRFRDKITRDKYLKGVTLKHYKTLVEGGIVKPETFEPHEKSTTKLMFGFEHVDGIQYFRVKAGTENIEIIEEIYADDKQMKLEL